MTLFTLILLSAFFVFIGIYHRFNNEDEDKNPPKIGLMTLAAALFVVVGAGEYDLSLAMIMDYGWAGLSFLLGLICAFVFISVFAKRIWRIRSSAEEYYTLDGYVNFTTPDFLHLAHGRFVSLLATVIVSSCFFGLWVFQVYLGGILLAAASGITIGAASILITLTVVTYAIAGGFYSLFKTDLFQAGLMYFSLIVATGYSIFVHSTSVNIEDFAGVLNARAIDSLGFSGIGSDPTVVAVFLLTICAAFGGADLWQRVNVSESAGAAKSALRRGALGILVFGILLFVFALDAISAMEVAGIETDAPFAAYLELVLEGTETVQPWPPLNIAIFSVGLLAAFVSTADTCLLLAASSIQNEVHRWTGKGVSQGGKGKLKLDKRVTSGLLLVLGAAGLLLSLEAPNVVEQFLIVLGALAVLGVPVFATLIGFGNKILVAISIIGGAIVTIYIGYIDPSLNQGWGLLLPCAPGLLCFLARLKNTDAEA